MAHDNQSSPMRICSCSIAIAALACGSIALGQGRQEPGKSIGSVAVRGNLIVMTLDEGVLGKASLFDLVHHTLRFTPEGSQYRAENVAWQWDPAFGGEITGTQAALKQFAFPFSGKSWDSFSVGVTGSMTFGESAAGGRGGRGGGISVDRFAELAQAGRALINTTPAISVFFKPRMSGKRYLKEFDDRAVITWDLTEPVGGIQDMTWTPTVNRFQAVLRKNGTIEMSYDEVAAQDAIVGIYPVVPERAEKELATIAAAESGTPARGIQNVKLSAVGGVFLKVSITTHGPATEGDGAAYRVCLSARKPAGDCAPNAQSDAVWTVQGGRGGRYFASGAGVSPSVKVEGHAITIQCTLPPGYRAGDTVFVSASAATTGSSSETISRIDAHSVKLAGLASPEVELSAVKRDDGPFPVIFQAFHYLKPPRAMDLACTVIKALGDKFDMLAYYSDFRIDNPEAGTSSTGPLGGGPAGGAVTGIGANQRNLASYCSQGRFQWQYIQPVYVGANQMQEYPPEGIQDPSTRNIVSYTRQLAERTSNGKIPPYDYAMSQIGHEMGHRWSAFVSAKVGGETIVLGPTHWARGLHAPVAFPYQRPVEASAMGGGVWQDNFDGTYTQLDDDYYVPATGWSYLDLYLMGLIAPSEVPDFFILRNLVPSGRDPNGRPIFKADRIKVTIQDVIAVEGPRLPDVDHAQKNFNTGMVVVVEHGKTPSKELLDRTEGIRLRWMDYWDTTTGHRSAMTTNPR
jgi:hypothetical protein